MTEGVENNIYIQTEKMKKFQVADNNAFLLNHLQMDLAVLTFKDEIGDGELNSKQFMAWTEKYSADFREAFRIVFLDEDDFMLKLVDRRVEILQELLAKTYELYDSRVGKVA